MFQGQKGESDGHTGSSHRKALGTEADRALPPHAVLQGATLSCAVSAFLQRTPCLPFPGPGTPPVLTAQRQSIRGTAYDKNVYLEQ